MRLLPFLLLVLAPALVRAQPAANCGSDDYFQGLRQGHNLVVPCDSMVLLTRATYERLSLETVQLRRIVELSDEHRASLEDVLRTQRSIVEVQRQDIAALEAHDAALGTIADRLETDLQTAIDNTDDAITIAKRNKVLGILLGGAGGVVVGLLVGAAAL